MYESYVALYNTAGSIASLNIDSSEGWTTRILCLFVKAQQQAVWKERKRKRKKPPSRHLGPNVSEVSPPSQAGANFVRKDNATAGPARVTHFFIFCYVLHMEKLL